MKLVSQYFNRRLITILFLGFSSGLPLALVGTTLQAWYTVSGLDIVTIGALSWIGQPYIYKFIWAPIFDRFTPPFLDRRRGWMVITQVGLLISIVILGLFSPKEHPLMMGYFALWVAFLSASQDISVDAYRADILEPAERGLGAAMGIGGYRIAMWVSSGIALILADSLGWQTTYFVMAMFMIIGMVTSWLAPALEQTVKPPERLSLAVVEPLKSFFSRDKAILLILFIMFFKLGESFTTTSSPMTTAFLLRGLEFSLTAVGTANNSVGLIASVIGIFLGGFILSSINLYRALMIFGVLQAIANLGFLALAIVGKNYLLMITAVFTDNLCAGMGMAALTALLMSLCERRYTASQFALLSALVGFTRIVAGPIGTLMVAHLGWTQAYFWSFVLSVPALFLLWGLRHHMKVHQVTAASVV
ncbi:MAG: MFS transporter [Proteobacteria bacterium]|nr:MFS transporter [Pseudomonadota bacterium]